MKRAPKSYLNGRRPPILEAIALEGKIPIHVAVKRLERKGYFTPRPRPWALGICDRGNGRVMWAVLDKFRDVVCEGLIEKDAELIIASVNGSVATSGAGDIFAECLAAYRRRLRTLLWEQGIANNPGVDDAWILDRIAELVGKRKKGVPKKTRT